MNEILVITLDEALKKAQDQVKSFTRVKRKKLEREIVLDDKNFKRKRQMKDEGKEVRRSGR